MKTLLLVNTGNDGDIIKESLQHNEKYFDKIIVLDRDSLDNTVEEIESLRSDKIHVMRSNAYPPHVQPLLNQSVVTTYHGFDYVFILDADEFIVADNLDELLTIPAGQVGVAAWKCYVPDDNVYANYKANITHRRSREPAGCHKVIIPTNLNYFLTLGNHHVHDATGQRIPHVELQSIRIAHFPVRSLEQYNRKIDFFRDVDLDPSQIVHLRNKQKITTLVELRDKALNYVECITDQTLVYDPVL